MVTKTLQSYYHLTKPGIIYGNLITTAAGFFLASQANIDFGLLAAILAGIAMIIASACVTNNFIDRKIDAKMERTKQRALVSGKISVANALVYAAVLGLLGFTILIFFTNWLTFWLGVLAFVDYVLLYGYTKRRSVHGTIVGSVAGALPPVAGYTAVTGNLDAAAYLLFAIFVCWQMPHFYAIAIYRLKDYKAAKIPVLSAVKGIRAAKLQIFLYTVAFVISASLLTFYDYTGYIYLLVILVVGLKWLALGWRGFKAKDDNAWARKMFGFSLIVNLTTSIMLAIGGRIP